MALQPLKRDPAADSKARPRAGILFDCAAETRCPHCGAVVPHADAKPLSSLHCPACNGTFLVSGRVGGFLLHAHIGDGEMGSVYRATDETLNRQVAVKLVRGCHVDDPASIERLRNEACAAGRLNHPRVAHVYALNFSNGHPYLVMELVSGQDFAQKLAREGRIDERTALRMALDVADGLSALNREGLVHGDLKPSNIVLDRDGNAKLVDFGLSGMTRQGGHGALVGTPNYIAPELLLGAADTHRSDIFSLGATLYHLLSGRVRQDGEKTISALKAKLFRRSVPLGSLARHVSAPTRALILRMLDPDPENRPATSDAVAAAVRESLSQLDAPTPVKPSVLDVLRLLLARLRLRLQPTPAYARRHASIIIVFGPVIVGLELLIAAQAHSFRQTRLLLYPEVSVPSEAPALPDRQPPARPETAVFVLDLFTTDNNLIWQSMNLGGDTPCGSTLRMGGTLTVQGPGTDMLSGDDHCRFVWTRASNDYAFSAQVKPAADNIGRRAVTGLLVKGEDPARGPGVLFGFLGSGELFLQIRQPNSKPETVKCSDRQLPLPMHLKITRRGHAFEASVSADGRVWEPFAACEVALPSANTIGFSVSAQEPARLATGTFANIRLRD
jgi:serine/threonine protein kinase